MIAGFIGAVASAAASIGSSIYHGVIDFIGDLVGAAHRVFTSLVNGIGNFASAAFNKAKSVGSSIWNGFKDGLGIGSPSYLERAMVTIQKNVSAEVGKIDDSLQKVTGMTATIASMNATGFGVTATRPIAIAPPPPTPAPVREGPVIGEITINNPVAEPAEESLFRAGQKVAYLGLAEVS